MFEYGPRPTLPLSEVEVFIGDILGKTGALTTRQRDLCISMKERSEGVLGATVKWITADAIGDLWEDGDGEEHGKAKREEKGDMVLAVGMACLWIALNENTKTWQFGKRGKMGRQLRSFGYVAAAVCMKEFI